MFVLPPGPAVYVDVDTTLIEWDDPKNPEDCGVVWIHGKMFYVNEYNVAYLKKFADRNHAIIVWSGSGVAWAQAVVRALGLTDYVHAVLSKPSYYIDDIKDPKVWIGKHRFYTLEGIAIHARDFIGEDGK